MIPIISINFAIIALLSFAIAQRLFHTRRTIHASEPLLTEFSRFYLVFGIAFLTWSLPGLIFSNKNYFEYFYLVGYFMLYVATAYMGYIALSFITKNSLARPLFAVAITLGVLFSVARFFTGKMPTVEIAGNFIFWQPHYPRLLRLATGIVSGLIALSSAAIFFMQGYKHQENAFVFNRAKWLAFGMLLLFIASLASFIAGSRATLIGSLEGTMLTIAALLSILKGVLHKKTV
jgi:hypothetical protein